MMDYRDPEIIDLPDEALPSLEELGGDLRLLAEIVGVRPALVAAQRIGGTPLRLPTLQKWLRQRRDRWLRATYDQGGVTVIDLARLAGISERQTYNILGSPEPDERQLKLF